VQVFFQHLAQCFVSGFDDRSKISTLNFIFYFPCLLFGIGFPIECFGYGRSIRQTNSYLPFVLSLCNRSHFPFSLAHEWSKWR
jgi:hypothetical protein